uniref:ShKT domain-containing protein n=1 Tax=Ditylenchus dipsaci TaxID=166011 RepID=A0A915DN95_9BILA
MATMCPHTCGLCDLNGAPKCKDKSKVCAEKEFKDSCNDANPVTKAAVRKDAITGTVPRTNDCRDEATNCDSQKDLCENPFYRPIMQSDCELSCVYCLPTNYVCQDKKLG